MKINNVTQIMGDSLGSENEQVAGQLGSIINPFMQQVVELSDGRIDFENRVENLIQIEMTVDASGVPVLNNKISTGKSNIRGTSVIRAFSSANVSIGATSQPFVNFKPLGGGLIEVTSITGLPANTKMRLNIIVY